MNLAKVATGLVAGVSHWRFRNIDRRLVLQLAIPGAIGALLGTSVLVRRRRRRPASRPGRACSSLVGLRILLRFSRPLPVAPDADGGDADAMRCRRTTSAGVEVAAAAGGVTNGLVGAWGPVVTPFLLHRGLPPRFAIGSVNTAEVAVAVVAAGSLITSLGGDGPRGRRGAGDARRRDARRAAGGLRRAVRARPGRWAWPSPGCCSSPRPGSWPRLLDLGPAAGSPTASSVCSSWRRLRPRSAEPSERRRRQSPRKQILVKKGIVVLE